MVVYCGINVVMNETDKTSPYIIELAELFSQDISIRGLHKGDPFYTTTEAGEVFGISRETARKVMQLLANRNILVRYRRRGTFVGAAAGQTRETGHRRECIILLDPTPSGWSPSQIFTLPPLMDQAMPESDIRTHIIPISMDISAIRALIEPARNAERLDGIVTISRTREVYEYLHGLNVPVVLIGTLDSGMPDLAAVDLEYYQSGYMLAEYIINKGHTHILANLAHGFGGDRLFVDGILDALTAAHLPPNSLKVRTFSGDFVAACANCRAFFEKTEDRPTAVIAEDYMLSDIVATAVRDIGLRIGKDVEIIYSGELIRENNQSHYVRTLPKLYGTDLAILIAKMLQDQRDGQPLKEKQVLIPVELSSG